ncbi:MAG: hypothetical protein EA402_09105 [Planctomycetota bacterium]|nr:MAG: hypothetical protein EA402_09105 [Planctomycetota bacterium]
MLITPRFSVLLICLAALSLSACVGGGGGNSGGDSDGPVVLVSGSAKFQRVVPMAIGGLSYNDMENFPIRGAMVELRRVSNNAVISSGTTSETGTFSLSSPSGIEVRIVVRAELPVAGGTTSVRTGSNTSTTGTVWSVFSQRSVPSDGLSGVEIIAPSGWTGSGYDNSMRLSGPFAILDVLYRARALVREVSEDDAPAIPIFWSPAYSSGHGSNGIGTSHFDPSNNLIRLLGEQNVDTDEFDHNVVAHEWIHAYQTNLSRDDSLGGSHPYGARLDETLAFSEALANAMSGIIMSNAHYRDTMGHLQGTTPINLDLRVNNPSGTHPGPWDEFALTPLLFNLAGPPPSGLDLGFGPLHQVLTGPFKTDTAFTTIYSFLYRLKALQPSQDSAIASRADNAGIEPNHDRFEGEDYQSPSGLRYTLVPADGSIITHDVDEEHLQNWGTENRLYHRLKFRSDLTPGTWTFRATPVNNSGTPLSSPFPAVYVANHGANFRELTFTISEARTVAIAVRFLTGSIGQRYVVQLGPAGSLGKVEGIPENDG